MEPVASVVDKLKGFAKSTQDFANGVLHWNDNSNRRNPIEILKRLQREAFSDLMKLRDRQDKVERILSYKSLKRSPFQETATHLRGEVDVLEALLMKDGIGEHNIDTLNTAVIRSGVHSRFTFESTIRQKDTLQVEFLAGEKIWGDFSGAPLSLSKVLYMANISDWFSAVAIPVGARCRDVGLASSSSGKRNDLTNYSSFEPPLLNQQHDTAIGIMVRKSNIVASLARLVSGVRIPSSSPESTVRSSMFGEVACQLSTNTKLSLLGLHQGHAFSSQQVSVGPLALPLGFPRRRNSSETSNEADDNNASGSIAVKLESELDECTRLGGWVELKSSNPKNLKWAVIMTDTPEDEYGWGLSVGGSFQGPKSYDRVQAEAFLKFNFGKRFSLQPAFVYVTDGTSKFPSFVLRSTWSL